MAREAIPLGLVDLPATRTTPVPAGNEPLIAGREAFARHDWERAVDLLAGVDAEHPLSADDLLLLGEALMWSNRHDG